MPFEFAIFAGFLLICYVVLNDKRKTKHKSEAHCCRHSSVDRGQIIFLPFKSTRILNVPKLEYKYVSKYKYVSLSHGIKTVKR